MQRPHERPVASVSQGGDDQAAAIAEVLVAIANGGVDHAHHHIARLPVVPGWTDMKSQAELHTWVLLITTRLKPAADVFAVVQQT